MLLRELLNEKYGDAYEVGEISTSEGPDYDMVEVINTRGEEYGHYSVLLYHTGRVEVISADKEPTATQKKQIIAIAKKHMEDNP